MRYKFESTFAELGYIKELLKEFNLPMYQVATDDTTLYEGELYIKDLGIYRCMRDTNTNELYLTKLLNYYYNRPVLNVTTNMSVTSSYYSTDIHEYLGRYLRFLRDYKKLDLMSLYNCFSNRSVTLSDNDDMYTYYAVPVRFNQVYTIGFDSTETVEMYCTFWSETEIKNNLKNSTRMVVKGCRINKPFIYSKLRNINAADPTLLDENATPTARRTPLTQRENLKLIIKLPKSNKTSITVLEGDYVFDTTIDGKVSTTGVYGFDNLTDNNGEQKYHLKTYPTALSLFTVNDEQKHPFADRLIEYLLSYAIDRTDPLDDNIKRTQEFLRHLRNATPKLLYGEWDDSMNDTIYQIATNSFVTSIAETPPRRYVRIKSNDIYEVLSLTSEGTRKGELQKNLIDIKDDLLMYVDKDVESLFLSTSHDDNDYTR